MTRSTQLLVHWPSFELVRDHLNFQHQVLSTFTQILNVLHTAIFNLFPTFGKQSCTHNCQNFQKKDHAGETVDRLYE